MYIDFASAHSTTAIRLYLLGNFPFPVILFVAFVHVPMVSDVLYRDTP